VEEEEEGDETNVLPRLLLLLGKEGRMKALPPPLPLLTATAASPMTRDGRSWHRRRSDGDGGRRAMRLVQKLNACSSAIAVGYG